ncbi:LPS export ABC transporter periplasmic protein LptC [Methylomarinum sp. Ch1-1]|uniref:LPS export ABC transporter periplasmic protein LptC n=1 Tax=Methylomarinum roseum TaxID=3067653 RepID=A0AAU7NY04_9GAMM|nr:LPS export ABC transporter periplasmic protein LptC [Methylomarinum sp. Ch1-1]MDP4521962.1 LPS export ABC transporter periplasmic protein LptC [Methylomarinum sp. Ch1-1]
MILQRYRLYIFLLILALVSWWWVDLSEKDDVGVTVAMKNSPDYFSNGYRKTEMSDAGIPHSDLLADGMIHYSGDGATHLQNPVMTLYNNSVSPWVIRSESGILSRNGEDLLLNGKVHINRESGEGVKPLTINTSELRVKLPDNYAETDEWAEIISPPNRTTGVGMEVTFVEPIHLKLLAKVKGRYEVN